ncbi:MAG TPA: hypothetical protein VLZ05_00820 [Mycobacterium sp.]|nr:hypothetical protein [Mycobacterium sp.]HUH67544.1 hypothetical protein [Mycobacterium sp.]
MLENRSFDHLLGYLYRRSATFDGLDGTQSNRDRAGTAVCVYPITPKTVNAYYYPLANPAEGFNATDQDQILLIYPHDGEEAGWSGCAVGGDLCADLGRCGGQIPWGATAIGGLPQAGR